MMRREDRFVLSKGHSAGALYVTLWSLGLLVRRRISTVFIGTTRCSAAIRRREAFPISCSAPAASAMACRWRRASPWRRDFSAADRRIFCLTSDGEWQEGSTLEAAIFASHQRLDNLVIMVDHNGLQGFGRPKLSLRCLRCTIVVSGLDLDIRVCDGHDLDSHARRPGAGTRQAGAGGVEHRSRDAASPRSKGRWKVITFPSTAEQYANAMASFEVAI